MPKRDGSADRIESLAIKSEGTFARDDLRGECLVDVDRVYLIQREPCALDRHPNRWDRAEPEQTRLDSGHCIRDHACPRGKTLRGY